ncbi:MAG TPA: hypothetical protein VIF57_13745 [Polyangia bacterium]
MGYTKHKLALFFTVQTLGVGAMIVLVGANLHPRCDPTVDCTPSVAAMILAMALILGELTIVAAALKYDLPVWRSLIGLGVVFLVAAFVGGLCLIGLDEPHETATLLAVWHVVIGLISLAAGGAAAFWDLLAKLRRPDGSLPEDQQLSAMWPLD